MTPCGESGASQVDDLRHACVAAPAAKVAIRARGAVLAAFCFADVLAGLGTAVGMAQGSHGRKEARRLELCVRQGGRQLKPRWRRNALEERHRALRSLRGLGRFLLLLLFLFLILGLPLPLAIMAVGAVRTISAASLSPDVLAGFGTGVRMSHRAAGERLSLHWHGLHAFNRLRLFLLLSSCRHTAPKAFVALGALGAIAAATFALHVLAGFGAREGMAHRADGHDASRGARGGSCRRFGLLLGPWHGMRCWRRRKACIALGRWNLDFVHKARWKLDHS
mmetsp:Transcript_67154/g.160176  ORF Transcript_67154/g.160176 Transcript_67154/m.160176 type:complete len:279 (+) Transcript_67154:106-942(+)